MNFDALQMLIKSLVTNFKCSSCSSTIKSRNVNLVGVEWSTHVNLEIKCPKCGKSTFIKSEVISINLSKANLVNEDLLAIKSVINSKNSDKIKKIQKINDSIIVDLDKNLKKDNINATDLFE